MPNYCDFCQLCLIHIKQFKLLLHCDFIWVWLYLRNKLEPKLKRNTKKINRYVIISSLISKKPYQVSTDAIISQCNFKSFVLYHVRSNFVITACNHNHWFIVPEGVLCGLSFIRGLTLSEASQLYSYLHFRKAEKLLSKTLLQRSNLDKSIDFMDTIEEDIPRGNYKGQPIDC